MDEPGPSEADNNMDGDRREAPRARGRYFGARSTLLLALLLIPASVAIALLVSWQIRGQQRALSLSNERRIAGGILLYAQDWDGRAMAPVRRLPQGRWQTWPEQLQGYVSSSDIFSNPSNPVNPLRSHAHDPIQGYPVNTSYAINRRLWNTFSPGPYPLDNLELPEQTVLLVEAGPMWRVPTEPPRRKSELSDNALLDYGDTTDRVDGFCPYPSTHDGRMAIVAADGHGYVVEIAHYSPDHGVHDPIYGRIGANIYNWNGGHLNGETERPPHE